MTKGDCERICPRFRLPNENKIIFPHSAPVYGLWLALVCKKPRDFGWFSTISRLLFSSTHEKGTAAKLSFCNGPILCDLRSFRAPPLSPGFTSVWSPGEESCLIRFARTRFETLFSRSFLPNRMPVFWKETIQTRMLRVTGPKRRLPARCTGCRAS